MSLRTASPSPLLLNAQDANSRTEHVLQRPLDNAQGRVLIVADLVLAIPDTGRGCIGCS